MDLTALLLRAGAARPHVLVVPAAGAAGVRLAVEADVVRRGWPLATSPADTDLLVVAGAAGPMLSRAVEDLWRQVPAPRDRTEIIDADDVARVLDAMRASLSDVPHQRATALAGTDVDPTAASANVEEHAAHDTDGGDAHGDHESAAGHEMHAGHTDDAGHGIHPGHEMHGEPEMHGDPEMHDDAGRHDDAEQHGDDARGDDHGGHHGHQAHHGHHGGGMALPGGLLMADLGEDRDGLTLDRLHVPLGPVLPDWPAGLVLRVALQGDVIQEAAAEVLDAGHGKPFWAGQHPAARELDGLARFLGVAGWSSAAGQARRLRDDLLAGAPAGAVAGPVARLLLRVERSRTLRWLLRGVPAGDVDLLALLGERLDATRAATVDGAAPAARPKAAELPEMLVGAELAAARLVVAALDPDTEPADVAAEVRGG